MTKPLTTALALVAFSFPTFTAEAQDAETASLLKEIEAIRKLLESSSEKNNARALSVLRAALASPKATYEFHMDSVKQVNFDEEGRPESDWREWRDANEEERKESEHIQALQLQLRYLALSIQASGGRADDDALKAMMPDLVAYLDSMTTAAVDFEEHRELLERSVLESPGAKRLKPWMR